MNTQELQKQKLMKALEETLENPWKVDLFRRYLQECHADILLDFYIRIKSLKEKISKVETQAFECKLSKEEKISKKIRIAHEMIDICKKYGKDQLFPAEIKKLLIEYVVPNCLNLLLLYNVDVPAIYPPLNEFISTFFLSSDNADEFNDLFAHYSAKIPLPSIFPLPNPSPLSNNQLFIDYHRSYDPYFFYCLFLSLPFPFLPFPFLPFPFLSFSLPFPSLLIVIHFFTLPLSPLPFSPILRLPSSFSPSLPFLF